MRIVRFFVGIMMVFLMMSSYAHQAKYDTSRYMLSKAPASLDGRYIKTTVLYGSGFFKQFMGETFEDHFVKNTFTCKALVPSPMKPHEGEYRYQRVTDFRDVGLLTVHHSRGHFRDLSYQTYLYFYSTMGGTFKIMQNKQVMATGVFFLS